MAVKLFWNQNGKSFEAVPDSAFMDVFSQWDGYVSPDGDFYATKPTGYKAWPITAPCEDCHELCGGWQLTRMFGGIEESAGRWLREQEFRSNKDALVYGKGWASCTFSGSETRVDSIMVPSGQDGRPKYNKVQKEMLLIVGTAHGFTEDDVVRMITDAEGLSAQGKAKIMPLASDHKSAHTPVDIDQQTAVTKQAQSKLPGRVREVHDDLGWTAEFLEMPPSPRLGNNNDPTTPLVHVAMSRPDQWLPEVHIVPNTIAAVCELVGSANLIVREMGTLGPDVIGLYAAEGEEHWNESSEWMPGIGRSHMGLIHRQKKELAFNRLWGQTRIFGNLVVVRAITEHNLVPRTILSLYTEDIVKVAFKLRVPGMY